MTANSKHVIPDVATCTYYTGIDPFTKKPVTIAKGMRDRKMQRALMQFFMPENYFEVRVPLIQTGRAVIGDSKTGVRNSTRNRRSAVSCISTAARRRMPLA